MELSISSYSRKIAIRTDTTSVRRTRRPAMANSLSASTPSASSLLNLPMLSPPRQQAALLVSHPPLDRTQTPSAPPPVVPAVPPRSHKILRRLNLQGLASRRLWAVVGVHSVNRQRSAVEMHLASLRPLVAAARSADLRVLDRPEEVASASLQHLVSQPVPLVLPISVNRPSLRNLHHLVALVSLHSWARNQTRLPPAVLEPLPAPSERSAERTATQALLPLRRPPTAIPSHSRRSSQPRPRCPWTHLAPQQPRILLHKQVNKPPRQQTPLASRRNLRRRTRSLRCRQQAMASPLQPRDLQARPPEAPIRTGRTRPGSIHLMIVTPERHPRASSCRSRASRSRTRRWGRRERRQSRCRAFRTLTAAGPRSGSRMALRRTTRTQSPTENTRTERRQHMNNSSPRAGSPSRVPEVMACPRHHHSGSTAHGTCEGVQDKQQQKERERKKTQNHAKAETPVGHPLGSCCKDQLMV